MGKTDTSGPRRRPGPSTPTGGDRSPPLAADQPGGSPPACETVLGVPYPGGTEALLADLRAFANIVPELTQKLERNTAMTEQNTAMVEQVVATLGADLAAYSEILALLDDKTEQVTTLLDRFEGRLHSHPLMPTAADCSGSTRPTRKSGT